MPFLELVNINSMKYAYSKMVCDLGKKYGAFVSSIENNKRYLRDNEVVCVEVEDIFNKNILKWSK